MARLPRLAVGGLPHHLIQRGNNRQPIFVDDADRKTYLDILSAAAQAQQVALHAYVLMDNHVHLLATPERPEGLSLTMQALGRRYVAWFNHRHGRTGTLWEGRFRATVIESERYFLACMRYIELNPVRAGLVLTPADHPWSSAAHHLGLRTDPLVRDHPLYWALGNTPFEREAAYRELLEQALTHAEAAAIMGATQKGWALGSAAFIHQLASQTERRLEPLPRGRPRRKRSPSP